MNDKLKKIIFDKLYQDLKNVEIVPYYDSIWFIDREKKYWYFEYEKSGTLYWRYKFFNSFFHLFSLKLDDCKLVMSEWVEEVLNCKVNAAFLQLLPTDGKVEEVLNYKVNATPFTEFDLNKEVDEVLNCKVNTTELGITTMQEEVDEVLNCKVNTTQCCEKTNGLMVEEVLNCKVNTTVQATALQFFLVEEVLNCKVNTTRILTEVFPVRVEEVLNYHINIIIPYHSDKPKEMVEHVLKFKVTNTSGNQFFDNKYLDAVLNQNEK